MDFDASTLVYIIAVIVYFLYSTFFSKKEPGQAEQKSEQPEVQPKKAVSFDDLLKEIRREQGERERDLQGTALEEEEYVEEADVPEPVAAPRKYFTYEDPEQFPSSDNKYQTNYKNFEKGPLVKLDDQIDLNSDQKILGEVEDVGGYAKRKNKYAEILKNPETVKDAVVISEILRPKYF
jgi:hypothetical protein